MIGYKVNARNLEGNRVEGFIIDKIKMEKVIMQKRGLEQAPMGLVVVDAYVLHDVTDNTFHLVSPGELKFIIDIPAPTYT